MKLSDREIESITRTVTPALYDVIHRDGNLTNNSIRNVLRRARYNGLIEHGVTRDESIDKVARCFYESKAPHLIHG